MPKQNPLSTVRRTRTGKLYGKVEATEPYESDLSVLKTKCRRVFSVLPSFSDRVRVRLFLN